ncbi:hypothetical protein [uncultured Lutibacter sp.]|jgi:hypothetical protein|uniref:hypothetical protein n=1 Tax=uncultured Lutibacter sp. TaxID=437739 RepID=UPI0026131754|nr:hypothetical protein [uncultured Lutibacter sp.]
MKIDLKKLTDLEFDGIDMNDYPDFVDAFLSNAYYIDRDLTDEELDYINDNEYEFVNENAYDSLF